MTARSIRPHVLGVDDGPFDKRIDSTVSVVGVMTEGADLVEAVATTSLAVDGEDATDRLADWVAGLRFASALHAMVLGGITIAGLGVVDIERLAERLGRPVMIVNRQQPNDDRLIHALRAAGLEDRIPIVERAPRPWQLGEGLFVAHAGSDREEAGRILSAVRLKSRLPEPLRLAHLIAAAIVNGESRGRP
jgi:endonuclease V-like protein UPF0215 family